MICPHCNKTLESPGIMIERIGYLNDAKYDYTKEVMLRYEHKCAGGCGGSMMCVSTTDAEDYNEGWITIFNDKGKKDYCPKCKGNFQ